MQEPFVLDLIFQADVGFSGNPEEKVGNREYTLDCLPQELLSDGVGDYWESCIALLHEDGSMAADFRFESYEIFRHLIWWRRCLPSMIRRTKREKHL